MSTKLSVGLISFRSFPFLRDLQAKVWLATDPIQGMTFSPRPDPQRELAKMTAGGSKSLPCLGFLTVSEHADHGLFGGYLVLNTAARPLEFHCTAPVKPNRAQQILYGPTLKPYLYGEQIGCTLVTKAKHRPLWICTDVVHVLELRSTIDIPVLHLVAGSDTDPTTLGEAGRVGEVGAPSKAGAPGSPAETGERLVAAERVESAVRVDGPHGKTPGSHLRPFLLGDFEVAVRSRFADDQKRIRDDWERHTSRFDLEEPFARIRSAIEEAQRSAR